MNPGSPPLYEQFALPCPSTEAWNSMSRASMNARFSSRVLSADDPVEPAVGEAPRVESILNRSAIRPVEIGHHNLFEVKTVKL
jgi:hypothetical protein